MKNKINRIRFFKSINTTDIVLILIALLLIGGLFIFERENPAEMKGNKKLVIPTQTAGSATTIPMPTSIWKAEENIEFETNNREYEWKTYKNDTRGFEFKYPEIYTVQEKNNQTIFSIEGGLPYIIISYNSDDFIDIDQIAGKAKKENADLYFPKINKESINFGGHKASSISIENLQYIANEMIIVQTIDNPEIQIQIHLLHRTSYEYPNWYLTMIKQRAKLVTSSFLFYDADEREGGPDRIEPLKTTKFPDTMPDFIPYGTDAKYTSYDLGITFNFTFEYAPHISRKQNKICWDSIDDCILNLEVFTKDLSQSFKEAAEANMKSDKINSKRYLLFETDTNNPNIECAEVVDLPPISNSIKSDHCPILGGGKKYLADKNFPNKFVSYLVVFHSYPTSQEFGSVKFIK